MPHLFHRGDWKRGGWDLEVAHEDGGPRRGHHLLQVVHGLAECRSVSRWRDGWCCLVDWGCWEVVQELSCRCEWSGWRSGSRWRGGWCRWEDW
eukprot:3886475-Amphidinium_carterae.1